ncbi:beta and beta-prime subunits of DNA dependent RNA-polymerase [Myriangium duriaei CBS 260.36]|uniref:DNA-directed RNA polymerase subunit n=1 Tax=Myriangium duriaei CBS 260.36 TaxID=1168546 RepID=A0A9P4J573_9PEZI|nr:beta and beta-prime subunits of DNA dependent RNA-polymerase [Myriangium duriaei CBS 260.36]
MSGGVDFQVKEQVVDNVPKKIKELQFGVLTHQDIAKQSVVEITSRNVYDIGNTPGAKRTLTANGPLDPHLGTSSKTGFCSQCNEDLKNCNGHFGHVKLALPAFHIGYFKKTIEILQIVCKDCSQLLLDENTKRKHLRAVRRPDLDSLRKDGLCKKISDEAKKTKVCPFCGSINGAIRKVPSHPIKVIHIRFHTYATSNAKNKIKPDAMLLWEKSFEEARQGSADIEKNVKRAVEDMTPLRALNIFKRISSTDVELLGMDPDRGRPEMFIWQYIPAPPVAIRPSVAQEAASTEDDITNKLGDIIHINNVLKAGLQNGQPLHKVIDIWEFLQVQIAMYIDGNLPGLGRDSSYGKPLRGFNQRLKGKQGRFRGNLSGKRVDFSGRTVISPDPNLSIEEVAVPLRVAKNMTYPEQVTRYNIEKLRDRVRNGKKRHPGANFIVKKNGRRLVLEFLARVNKLENAAQELQIGDIVERHLEDGDIALFNRQPSLHKLSILSHKVKVRPWRTFRLNECVCNPYNADFDGDEMNLHIPQTEEARTEAIMLMGVKYNLATPKNGTPIIAAIQDFISCAFLSSSKDLFFDRKTFTHICSVMFDGETVRDPSTGERMSVELPPPTIWKPQMLWTGKQIWNILIRPNPKMNVLVNLEAKCKAYAAPPKGVAPDMNENDAYLVIRNSIVMCGYMDKATVGDGKKDSVFYILMRDFGPEYAVAAMNRLAKLSSRWLTNQGFSIGISDVYPSQALIQKKVNLVKAAEDQSTALIEKFDKGQLDRDAGCDLEMTLENRISGILNKVRQEAGDACFAELSRRNTPVTMAKCGSKGSNINVSQMIAAVGQQIIGGKRVLNGFQDRTLPHFTKHSKEPSAKGFVGNSFFTGLTPTEFIFHAMSGREGLVDTAVKTAETGYMSRRLMKSLEDLSAQYDFTVRNSSSQIVQFQYGDDKLDPVDMEGSAKPVHFDRSFSHAVESTWSNEEPGLRPEEIKKITADFMKPQREKLLRKSLLDEDLSYNDKSDMGVDQLESARDFLQEVQDYLDAKADNLTGLRLRKDMSRLVDGVLKISDRALNVFLNLCLTKYHRSQVEPGHAVGAVGAQSIGEPGTQMTLKTFHFAGVAGMSITQGVPRIKEIINASKTISTPVISCALDSRYETIAGQLAKAMIEKTYLHDIIDFIEDMWSMNGSFLQMRINWETVNKLGLRVNIYDIRDAVFRSRSLKAFKFDIRIKGHSRLRVYPEIIPDDGKASRSKSARTKQRDMTDVFAIVQDMRRLLPGVVIKGYPDAQRAVVQKDNKPDATGREPVSVLVEGYGLKACMTTEGVNGMRTRTNSVMECKEVLGIEAARKTIIDEISSVMGGMDIDPRHMQLLADVMTYKGEVLGITRFGLAKMRDSVLQLASFEKTPDHLFAAAIGMKKDRIEGVSECIIMGQSMSIGTGAMRVVRSLGIAEEEVPDRKSAFEDAWAKIKKSREGAKKVNGTR